MTSLVRCLAQHFCRKENVFILVIAWAMKLAIKLQEWSWEAISLQSRHQKIGEFFFWYFASILAVLIEFAFQQWRVSSRSKCCAGLRRGNTCAVSSGRRSTEGCCGARRSNPFLKLPLRGSWEKGAGLDRTCRNLRGWSGLLLPTWL